MGERNCKGRKRWSERERGVERGAKEGSVEAETVPLSLSLFCLPFHSVACVYEMSLLRRRESVCGGGREQRRECRETTTVGVCELFFLVPRLSSLPLPFSLPFPFSWAEARVVEVKSQEGGQEKRREERREESLKLPETHTQSSPAFRSSCGMPTSTQQLSPSPKVPPKGH